MAQDDILITQGIVDAILEHIYDRMQEDLINEFATGDPEQVGVVSIGPLQGDPVDPDEARISVEIHHNDPEHINGPWRDAIVLTEIGGAATWARRFTTMIRCLFVDSGEPKDEARGIASAIKDRAENILLKELYTGINAGNEYVSRGSMARSFKSKMLQGGGPPDAYDFHIKIWFEVWTTVTEVYS
jgi:hypothetical protein